MQKEDEKLKKEKQDAFKNGNAALIGSAGFAAMGTGLALGSSFICPVCMFATPALLGTGIYQKLKSKKISAKNQTED